MKPKRPLKAVIPCAGFGTRFLPATKAVPKELLPVGNKPAIHYIVEEAAKAGAEEVVLVCNRSKLSIAHYFLPDAGLDHFLKKSGKAKQRAELDRLENIASIQVVYQKQARGLGDAIRCARSLTGGDPFLVLLPDDLFFASENVSRRLVRVCREKGSWGVLLERVPPERISSYGIVGGKEREPGVFEIESLVEKPSLSKAPSDLAIVGRYFLPPDIYPLIGSEKKQGREIQLTDALNELAKTNPGWGVVYDGNHFDVGSPSGLFQAWRWVAAGGF